MELDQVVKFTKDSKYDSEFRKGDKAKIKRLLVPYPQATDSIYFVEHQETGDIFWVHGSDIKPWDQLELDLIGEKPPISYHHCIFCQKDATDRRWADGYGFVSLCEEHAAENME
jgi:hypothetical protein